MRASGCSAQAAPPSQRRLGHVLLPILVFVAIFAVKVALSLLVRSPWIIPDETDYAAAAESTWNRGRLLPEVRGGQPYPPGYSFVLSPAYAAGHVRTTYHLMLAINCLLTTLVGVAAYAVALGLLSAGSGRRTAPAMRCFCLAVGVAVCLAPSTWLTSYVLMSENLFGLFFILSCWAVLRMGEGRSAAWAGLLGVLFALMFLTRSISVALLPALILGCVAAGRGAVRIGWRVALVAAGAAAGIAPWLVCKRVLQTGTVTGYSEALYARRLQEALSSGERFLQYVRILANDLGALSAVCGGVFLILAVAYLLRRATWRDARSRTVAVYGFAAMLGTLLLAGVHQFGSFAVRGIETYAVLSRYLDPLVPVFLVLGGVALWRFRTERWTWFRVAGMTVIALAVFGLLVFVLPTKHYKTPNTLGIWHLGWLRTAASARLGAGLGRVGPWALYVAFAGAGAWALCDRRAYRGVLIGGLLLAACGVPTLREILRASRATAGDLRLGQRLHDVGRRGATVYVDETIYAFGPLEMHREVLMLRFWNPDKKVLTRRRDVAAGRPGYLVSAESWPYRVLARRTEGPCTTTAPPAQRPAEWVLYEIDAGLDPLTGDPDFIDLAAVPGDRLEGFHGVDAGDYRWTTRRSVVHLGALPRGVDLVITLGLDGGRPSTNPAQLQVYFDGHRLAEFEKKRGGLYPSVRVPAALVSDEAHRLALRMNTFRPCDYEGWPNDTRDLGVQLRWIKIRPAGHVKPPMDAKGSGQPSAFSDQRRSRNPDR